MALENRCKKKIYVHVCNFFFFYFFLIRAFMALYNVCYATTLNLYQYTFRTAVIIVKAWKVRQKLKS